MTKQIEEVRRLLNRRLAESADTVLYGEVTSVDESNRLCDVKIGNITYYGVLLYGIEKSELKGRVYIPKVGSLVLVARVGGSNRLYVAMFSEIDKVVLTIGDKVVGQLDAKTGSYTNDKSSVVVNGGDMTLKVGESTVKLTEAGITVIKGGAGLLKTLQDLIDAITQLTVTTSVGPSGTPINAVTFMQIKQDLNNYLED